MRGIENENESAANTLHSVCSGVLMCQQFKRTCKSQVHQLENVRENDAQAVEKNDNPLQHQQLKPDVCV